MLLLRKSHPATRTMIGGDPTPEQAKAGDYPKLRQDWHGLTIAIEHPEGTVREGVDETGKPWRTVFRYAYGEILGTTGMDGDPVDVFIGNYPEAPEVYVVQQMKRKQWDVADEQKCMINFGSMDEARQAYLAHYDDPRFFGGITAIPVAEFITKVRATREKPTMIKSILFFKGFVGPYMRGGKMVNLNGYHGSRTKKVHATTGQTSLFGDLAPPPEVKQTAKVARALTTWMQRHGGPAGMARLLADMSPEHQEKLVDAMAKIGKTDAATVRGLLADGQKAPASTGERDLFSEPEQSAAKEAPQEKPKNNLAEGLPKTEGDVIARKEVTMMVNKRQENGKFSRYATGRYIITLQSAEGKKFIIAYSVMSKNGVSTTVMIPTEMLEDGAFSKLNDEAIKLFNAPSGGLFDGDKEDTITMPRAEAVKEHERLVDVLRSPSHEDDKAEAKKQAEELKEYKGEDASGDQEQTREDYKAMVDRISEFHAKKIGRQSVAQLKKMIQGKIKEGFNRFEKAANGDWVLTDGKRAYNITQNEQLRTYGSLIEAMVYHANAKPAEKPKAPAKKVEYTTDANGVPRDKNGYARMKMGRKNVAILPFGDSGQYAIRDAKTAITQMGEDGKPLVFTSEAAAIAHVRGGQSTTKPTPKKILTVAPGTTAAAAGGDGKPAGATSRKPFDLVPDDEAITRIKAAGYEMTDAGERSVFVDGNQQKRRAFSLKHSGNGKLGVGDKVTLPIAEDMLLRIEERAQDAKDGKLTSGANLLNASARQMRNETVDYKKPAVGEQAAPKPSAGPKIHEWTDRETAPVGSWVKADFKLADSQPVYQVRDLPLDGLYLPELDSSGRLQPEKRKYLEGYIERAKAGERAPSINVIEMESGKLRVVDGHRRAMAARAAGKTTIRALVSPLIDTPDGKKEATAELLQGGGTPMTKSILFLRPLAS